MQVSMSTLPLSLRCIILVVACIGNTLGETTEADERHQLSKALIQGSANAEQLATAIDLVKTNPISHIYLAESLPRYGAAAHGVIPVLIEQLIILDEGDWYPRATISRVLGDFGPAAANAVPRLIEIMQAGGHGAGSAQEALGKIQDARAIPALLERLNASERSTRWAAEALAKFSDEALREYCTVNRAADVKLNDPIDSQISTREDFSLKALVHYMGRITIDGVAHQAAFPEYSLPRDELVYIITAPDQSIYRLTMELPPDKPWMDISLNLGGYVSFGQHGHSKEIVWAQNNRPDFSQEGVYSLALEGVFDDPSGTRPPLPFRSNAINFEISREFLSEAEKQRIADEKFDRENPLGPVYVNGHVNTPGRYGYQDGMRLSQAIKLAGGVERLATIRQVTVTRDIGGKKEVLNIDLEAIYNGEAPDPLLKAHDHIYVPQNCVVEGSLIDGEAGRVPVETLRVGDQVVAFDLSTGTSELATIRQIQVKRVSQYLRINNNLMLTEGHPVYANGYWRPTVDVRIGMSLLTQSGVFVDVFSVEHVYGEVRVFDLSVDPPHTFFVEGFLTHNKI